MNHSRIGKMAVGIGQNNATGVSNQPTSLARNLLFAVDPVPTGFVATVAASSSRVLGSTALS